MPQEILCSNVFQPNFFHVRHARLGAYSYLIMVFFKIIRGIYFHGKIRQFNSFFGLIGFW